MPGVDEKHDDILRYLDRIFSMFFEYYGGGRVLRDPMLMRIKEAGVSRSPDIQILLPENLGLLKGIQVIGASDLVIEVVSPGSERIDRIQKLEEYERGGVKEYWIIDPIHKEALFYLLNTNGLYERQIPDENDRYYCSVVKGLWISIPTLWQKPIPTGSQILEWLKGMKP
ncbi:MAG: Uma2 family endonuclease [Anaerolineae bacterium]|nr:Uma2 family endonuclease [Anaerolineae bacterium]